MHKTYTKVIASIICVTCKKPFDINISQRGKKYCKEKCRPTKKLKNIK